MNNILLALQSFDEETDVHKHPRITIIFNNVSGYHANESKAAVELYKTQRINQYKIALKQVAMRFYMTDVSDQTYFGYQTWKEIKEIVCQDE